ncbi:G2/mitotic-specific cyclin, partial [Nowakowskiella sp. JEL0078]
MFYVTSQQQPHQSGEIPSNPQLPVTIIVAPKFSIYPGLYYKNFSMSSTRSTLSSSTFSMSLTHEAFHGPYRHPNGGSNSSSSTISSCSTVYSDSVAESVQRQKMKVPANDHRISELFIDTTASRLEIKCDHSPVSPTTAQHEQLDVIYKVSQAAIDSFLALEDARTSPDIELYGADIFKAMKVAEKKTMPNPYYIQKKLEIYSKTRAALIYKLIDLHQDFGLTQESLYLAINTLDRFCSIKSFHVYDYFFLGVTCLWIAAKFEENHGRVPNLRNLIFACDGRFSPEDFVNLERIILSALSFNMSHPTVEAFLKILAIESGAGPQVRAVARYLLELAVIREAWLLFKPSTLASAAIVIAEEIMGGKSNLQCDEEAYYLLKSVAFAVPVEIYRKFKGKKFLKAGQIVDHWSKMLKFESQQFELTAPLKDIITESP